MMEGRPMGKKPAPAKKRKTYIKNTHRLIIGDSRNLQNIEDESVQLVVTSPPAWESKKGAGLGKCRSVDEYCRNLSLVWQECARVLSPGCMICIYIERGANRFYSLRAGKSISVQSVVVETCRTAGFKNNGVIIYQPESGEPAKTGTKRYLPRTGSLDTNVDLIMIMKKNGDAPSPSGTKRDRSTLSAREAKKLLSGLWIFPGLDDDTVDWPRFPEELAQRLVKLFSCVGETVLDPFAGGGTTCVAAKALSRSSIGCDLNDECCDIVEKKMTSGNSRKNFTIEIQPDIDKNEVKKKLDALRTVFPEHSAQSKQAKPAKPAKQSKQPKQSKPQKQASPQKKNDKKDNEFTITVETIYNADHVLAADGKEYKLAGVEVPGEFFSRNRGVYRQSFNFMQDKVAGKQLKCRQVAPGGRYEPAKVYIFLDNGSTLNEQVIKSGYALSDHKAKHDLKNKFNKAEDDAKKHDMGMWALKKTDAPRS